MPYRYRDDLTVADIGFEAQGGTPEELFLSAWEATLRVMIENPSAIERAVTRNITLEEPSLDLLLHNFLQELIYHKDAEALLLRIEQCRIEGIGENEGVKDPVRLEASAVGEAIDPGRHRLGTDVKAVTFHNFSLTSEHRGWKTTVVLDV
ncbi:MAG: archease [Spirochaetaceae bacterium]|nr:MAG: archease [Spirochaetaceae bacterium]